MVKYFSTFSGIGGFELGIGDRGNCVGYSEVDRFAIQIYEKQFKGHKNYGDITKINTGTLPNFDLLVGGFPCQAFSIAGKRGGFEDTRGTLFFELARILKDKRPRYFVFENVKGLLSHDEGNTFKTIITVLDGLGYFIEWCVLNSKYFGVPQNRERVFIVGHLGGESKPKVFTFRENETISYEEIRTRKRQSQTKYSTTLRNTQNKADGTFVSSSAPREFGFKEACPALLTRDYKDPKLVADFRNDEGLRVRKEDISPSLTARRHSETDVSTMPPVVMNKPQVTVHNLQPRNANRPSLTRICDCGSGKLYKRCCGVDGGSGHLSKKDGTTYCLDSSPQGVEVVMNTVTEAVGSRAGSSGEFKASITNIHKAVGSIRRLTPVECERLQGFPDNWTKQGIDGKGEEVEISDTQRYKTLGNAVTVNVVEFIMERLLC